MSGRGQAKANQSRDVGYPDIQPVVQKENVSVIWRLLIELQQHINRRWESEKATKNRTHRRLQKADVGIREDFQCSANINSSYRRGHLYKSRDCDCYYGGTSICELIDLLVPFCFSFKNTPTKRPLRIRGNFTLETSPRQENVFYKSIIKLDPKGLGFH